MLKQVLILCCCFLLQVCVHAQQNDSLLINDSLNNNIVIDSTGYDSDTTQVADSLPNTITKPVNKKPYGLNEILKENIFLNSGTTPVSLIQSPRKYISKDLVFYLLALILLFLGVLKVAWPRYFSNLVRVFFNTSLRQGQLTDQLLQAKLPSMFFNLFFIIMGGWYLFLLLNYFGKITYQSWDVLLVCIAGLFLIYVIKFCTLRFAGWLTGYKDEAETYIFIVFLINKIISICLVPIVIIMPFSLPGLINIAVLISYILIVLMFIMRFFRSYGLLQTRLKVSGFHFFLYIIGVELLPLLLIYKFALIILSKNL
jgi:hypothetical protein